MNPTKNICGVALVCEPPVFKAPAFERAQVHVGLADIPLLSSILQFLEYWGADGPEGPVPYC